MGAASYGVVLLVGAPPKKGSGEFSILKVRVKVQIEIDFGTMLARAKSCTSKHRTEINFDLNFDMMKTFKMKILLSSFWGERGGTKQQKLECSSCSASRSYQFGSSSETDRP